MNKRFRVAVTHDFLKPDGTLGFGDIGLDSLSQNPRIEREFLPDCGPSLPASVANEFDALLLLAPAVTQETLAGCGRLALIARFGVGYDNVDVPACTQNNVLLTITPSGVRRPVAVAALTLLLACAHKLIAKDRLTRAGRWNEKLDYMGVGLAGRTLGLIGLGNIGREILRVVAPLDMRLVANDPFLSLDDTRSLAVEMLPLEALLRESDFDGIDVLWIGHNDLSISLGIPGEFDAPQFHEAVARVLEACHKHGKIPGMAVGAVSTGAALLNQGFRMLAYGGDLWLYQTALRQGIGTLSNLPRS